MIALFNPRRTRLLGGVIAVALAQLGATVTVAHALHGSRHGGWWIAAAAALIGFGCEVLVRRLSEGLGLDYVSAVRADLFRHLMAVEPAVVAQRRHGAMLQSFVGDLTALRQWVAEGIMRAIIALIALGGLLAWMCLVSPRLGLIALAIVGLSAAFGAAIMVPLSRSVRQVRRARGRVAAFASERLAASATVFACARAGSEARRLSRRVARLNAASLRRAWYTGMLRATPHLAATGIVIAAGLTGRPVSAGGTAGMILVIGIIGLALRDLARAAELLVPGRISRARIGKLMLLPTLDSRQMAASQQGEARRLVLDDLAVAPDAVPFSAEAGLGDVVLVDGDVALARALFATLGGLAMPYRGTARWNGIDLCALRPTQRRRIVGLASAQLPILAGSNGFNLRYRSPGANARDQVRLARVWDIDLHGRIEDSHRLILVRALMGQPPVLLVAPDASALRDDDAGRLADAIGDWPGVVLLHTGNPLLAAKAARRWRLSADGLSEAGLQALPQIPYRKDRVA